MKLVRPSQALVLVLGLSSWAAAADPIPCPEAYQKSYEAELGLTAKLWNGQCALGQTPEQILAQARRLRSPQGRAARQAPKNELAAQLGQSLQTASLGGLYDGGGAGTLVTDPGDGAAHGQAGSLSQHAPAAPNGFHSSAPPLQAREQYHTAEASKPGLLSTLWNNIRDRWNFSGYEMTAPEKKRMDEVKALIDSTASGKQLIADLGGWNGVNELVEVKFAKIANDHELGATFPYPDSRDGKKSRTMGLSLNQNLLKESPELVATVLGHELSHVRDMKAFGFNGNLSLASEFQAHREEAYIFEELNKRMTPAQRKEADKTGNWQYTRFVVALWEDHIVERYPKKEDFAATFTRKGLPKMAEEAYQDLANGKVAPGSPQLDFHIQDLYRTVTHEDDSKGEELKKDKDTLAKHDKLVAAMDARDAAFRKAQGYQIPAGVR